MMPVIRSEECLQWVQVVAVGTGSMEKKDQRRVLGAWSRNLRRSTQSIILSREQHAAILAGMGIGIEWRKN